MDAALNVRNKIRVHVKLLASLEQNSCGNFLNTHRFGRWGRKWAFFKLYVAFGVYLETSANSRGEGADEMAKNTIKSVRIVPQKNVYQDKQNAGYNDKCGSYQREMVCSAAQWYSTRSS